MNQKVGKVEGSVRGAAGPCAAAWEVVPPVRKERGERVHEGGQGALIDRGGEVWRPGVQIPHSSSQGIDCQKGKALTALSYMSLLSCFSSIERASHPAQLTDSFWEQPLLMLSETTNRPD